MIPFFLLHCWNKINIQLLQMEKGNNVTSLQLLSFRDYSLVNCHISAINLTATSQLISPLLSNPPPKNHNYTIRFYHHTFLHQTHNVAPPILPPFIWPTTENQNITTINSISLKLRLNVSPKKKFIPANSNFWDIIRS